MRAAPTVVGSCRTAPSDPVRYDQGHGVARERSANRAASPSGIASMRILIAEDDAVIRAILEAGLASWGHEVVACTDGTQAWEGLRPIVSYCKKGRDDNNYWQQVEAYVGQHSEAEFSHSICPDCYETIVKPELRRHQSKPR